LYSFEIRLNPLSAKDFFASLDSASSKKMRAELSELKNVFSFSNELIDNTDTMLKTPFANILISGTAGFPWNQAELLIEPQVVLNAAKEQNVSDSMASGTVVKKQTGSGRILISPLQERHAWP
jgi:hypothetical protein